MGLIEWAINALKYMGVYGVFIGVVLENIITLIPSALVPLMAGATLIPSDSRYIDAVTTILINIGLVGALASTISTIPLYILGYIGGKNFVDKYGKYMGVSWSEIEKAKDRIEGKNDLIIVLLRAIPIIPISPVSIALGIIRYGRKKFIETTFIGTLPRYLTLGLIGWIMKEVIWTIVNIIETAETIIIITTIVLIFAYITLKRRTFKITI